MADESVTEELSEKKKRKLEENAGKEEMSSERTLLAFERTLLAWVRTSTHLMTFGFAIYKLLEEKQHSAGSHPLLKYVTPKSVGMVMILSGLVGLALAVRRNIQIHKKYGKLEKKSFWAPAMLQAYVIMTLCLLMVIGATMGKG